MEIRFNEALAAIDKAGKRKQFDEKAKACTTIESKLNAAEAVLKDVGIVRESKPIKKHNGVADNFSENNPLRPVEEFRENSFSPGYIKETTDRCAKGDKVLFDGLLKLGKITEAEHAKLTGAKPKGYDQLTEQQRKDFDFARAVGLTEAQAFEMTKTTSIREVSRR
jgi:hypothetical protein